MDDERFRAAIAAFDAANSADPNHQLVAGTARPRTLVQAERLSACVVELETNPSLALRLAARCQHIERWTRPREDFPTGRVGYLRWRTELARFHADRAAEILSSVGYDEPTVQAVRRINLKQNLRSNPDSQTMEDALCLVFLNYELEDFLSKYPDEDKAIGILQKTWRKMSARGHAAALALPLSADARALVERALAAPDAASEGDEA
ncbi:MAG TPA: DUF4202 domain-containing protein [Polyangiaceae bacterium]|jgi:hypothetical protein|nr:DUF4202 domain-containing protein [Polyangiaceae bacterium]